MEEETPKTEKTLVISSENKPERDEKGRLLPGNTANPNGRPAGSLSLVAMLKEELLKCPEGEKQSYAELLIKRILREALINGDSVMVRDIVNRVDGLPKQVLALDPEDIITSLKIEIKTRDGENNPSDNSIPKESGTVSEEGTQDNS